MGANDVKKTIMIVVMCIIYAKCNMLVSIPDHLQECYRSGSPNITTPLRLDVFIDILRKVEEQADNLSLRVFTNSLLRSLRLDGIELAPGSMERPDLIPYRATAFQFSKYKLLMDHFLPGQSLMVEQLQVLSIHEKCLLHTMLSSTVDQWERSDERLFCPMEISRRERAVIYSQEMKSAAYVDRVMSRCPLEHGVIQTDWGTVAIGTVIAAIAASLELQEVSIADVADTTTFRESLKRFSTSGNTAYEIDEYIEQLVDKSITVSTDQQIMSNLWIATLAGDLAEVVVQQGPATLQLMDQAQQFLRVGRPGSWNDTLLPRRHYLDMDRNPTAWEITDAEILAGIDGLIIATHMNEQSPTIRNLRLSEILLQYYTDYGRFVGQIKACERASNFKKIVTTDKLLKETRHFSHILQLSRPGVIVSQEAFNGIVNDTVNTFMGYWPKLLADIPLCLGGQHEASTQLPAEFIVTTDGTWTGYQVEQLISTLSKTFNISYTGSTLSYIHGSNGNWVVPPSGSVVEIFNSIQNYTDEWPNRLNLPNVFTTVIQHKTNKAFSNTTAVHLPTVLLIIAPTERITTRDLERSKFLLTSLGNYVLYYDIKFIYVTTDPSTYYTLHNDWLEKFYTYIQISGNSVTDVTDNISLNLKTIQYDYRDIVLQNTIPCIVDKVNILVGHKSTIYQTVAKWNTNSRGGNLFIQMTSHSAGMLGCVDSTCYNLQKDDMTEFRIPIFPHSNTLYDGITVSLTNNCEGWQCKTAEVALTVKYQCSSAARLGTHIILLLLLFIVVVKLSFCS